MKLGAPEEKPKTIVVRVIVLLLFGAWITYAFWTVGISARTVLMPGVPEWQTYLLISAIAGLVAAGRKFFGHPDGKTARKVLNAFVGWFCVGIIFSINSYDAAAYLLPGEIIEYESGYEITYPGPSSSRFGHCEAGLWIVDSHTHRKIELCTNKADLNEKLKQGTNAVWVRARASRIGSYIVGYTFFHK
ncbi:hypothetical protein QZR14_01505 [Pseudomonas sp. rhizo66]|uniref:hypothetical protein n=1 Tax=Pseudomonas sp. rhizo66 TaxID=3059674 RepID=UPI00288CD196|nr:hypothetical protein [Pseudomonas sp. rhizo66]MDT3310017.1 hypothetical protein [Pseudomonas sp. rhizo66]